MPRRSQVYICWCSNRYKALVLHKPMLYIMAFAKPQHSERETVIYDVSVRCNVIMAASQNKSYYSVQFDMCVCRSARLHNSDTYIFLNHSQTKPDQNRVFMKQHLCAVYTLIGTISRNDIFKLYVRIINEKTRIIILLQLHVPQNSMLCVVYIFPISVAYTWCFSF